MQATPEPKKGKINMGLCLWWVSSEWERGTNMYEHMCVCVSFKRAFVFVILMSWLHWAACGILVP